MDIFLAVIIIIVFIIMYHMSCDTNITNLFKMSNRSCCNEKNNRAESKCRYVKSPINPDGMDAGKVKSMSDLEVELNDDLTMKYNTANIHDDALYEYNKFQNAQKGKWVTDMSIQIDQRAATTSDKLRDSLKWGNSLVNEKTAWASPKECAEVASRHISHGNDVLMYTDYEPEFYINHSLENKHDKLSI